MGCCKYILILSLFAFSNAYAGIKDRPFIQEYHQPCSLGSSAEKNDVRSIAVDRSGQVWAGTKTGAHVLDQVTGEWEEVLDTADLGSINDLFVDPEGIVWIAAWNGLYRVDNNKVEKIGLACNPLAVVNEITGIMHALGPDGIWKTQGEAWIREDIPYSRALRRLIPDQNEGYYLGTGKGLCHRTPHDIKCFQNEEELLSDDVYGLAWSAEEELWIGRLGGITVYNDDKRIKSITLKEGLPNSWVPCLQKARYYYNIMVQRHIREPYLVEKCRFSIPGDTTSREPKDDDNDGQYTGMYLVMESYRYAVTNDPEARENAAKAFHALKFLQTVTRTKGFVARTVIPATWSRMADPNVIISDREWADRIIREPREKKVEDQWLLSGDGKWLWKRGTSSDEITGHMYGYLFYYNLVANPEEKKDVEKHIVRIIDYIIENDYVLVDNKLNLERSIWLLQDNPLDLMRWDNNPWAAVQGEGGYTESDGIYWLLAYWMGRYDGLIE